MFHNVSVAMWSASDPDRRMLFRKPVDILTTRRAGEVPDLLANVEKSVEEGLYAVGFLSYESARGFDWALATLDPSPRFPLAWFALFSETEKFNFTDPSGECRLESVWRESVTEEEYRRAIARIKEYLRAGDTYQVNYTMRLRSVFRGDPLSLFARLCRAQRADYCFFAQTDDFAVCSVSPELFFSLDGRRLVSRPMKGTILRGKTTVEDEMMAGTLKASEKDRAENIMIVDMIRNDMGKVSEAGSVRVTSSFDVEKYPTVLQMTSTVESVTTAPVVEIFRAMFPCASVTGAPKVRAMQIISELEKDPRGVYTGSAGFVFPGRKAMFNVAIRTVFLDMKTRGAEYGVGGGIVFDSDTESEFLECRAKASVLTQDVSVFRLLETILWERGKGYFLKDLHLNRLERSAQYFGYPADRAGIDRELAERAVLFTGERMRVRLLLTEDGKVLVEHDPMERTDMRPWRVALSMELVDSGNVFLYHKTTNRTVYDRARRMTPECDDVILLNGDGFVTESTLANVVVVGGGRKITPPVRCGLLGGTFREHLLARGEIEEGMLVPSDLARADKIFLINSLRGWIPAILS